MADSSTSPVDSTKAFGDAEDPASVVRRWNAEITLAENEIGYKNWRRVSAAITKRYRDDRKSDQVKRVTKFNVLWSNIQSTLPAIYGRPPKPEVDRRYKDADPAARVASQVLERAISGSVDNTQEDLNDVLRRCTLDYLLGGLGQARVYYKPTWGDELPGQQDPQGAPLRQKTYEQVTIGYSFWGDFLWQPARQWSEVNWVAWREYMTRRQLIERFGADLGGRIPLDTTVKAGDDTYKQLDSTFKRATVFEVWNKEDRETLWISPMFKDQPLDRQPDPLGLKDFFPCPKPLLANTTNETLVPVADFHQYEDLALELDEITARLDLLIRALRVAGVYDASIKAPLGNLLNDGRENILIPVEQWAMFAEKGGFKGTIDWMPIEQIAKVVGQLYQAREATKQAMYEITGISDIIRGASMASETATAQQIKGRFATLRMGDRQQEIARFARDLVRLMGEVIAEHFSWPTLSLMTGIELPSDAQIQAQMMQQQAMAMQAMQPQLPPPGLQGAPA